MADYIRQVPVHWNDCDPARIVFHAHFIRWMDEGFHELMRARGVDEVRMTEADPGFRGAPLVNVACNFSVPAVYGDLLEHRIAPPEFGAGKSFGVKHQFWRNGTLLAQGEQSRIWGQADPTGRLRAVPVPEDIRARLRGE